jgi:hypothetical protein
MSFWVKATVALLIAMLGLTYICRKIYGLYIVESTGKPTFAKEIAIPSTGCARPLNRAILEPPDGVQMLGMSLDWALITPIQMRKRLDNFSPALVGAFMQLDTSKAVSFDFPLLLWHGYFIDNHSQEAQRISAILELTIEPTRSPSEISTIPLDLLTKIADHCLLINTQYGYYFTNGRTPILLRFGHEMNGDWTFYGMKPIEFILGFQRMAALIHVNFILNPRPEQI